MENIMTLNGNAQAGQAPMPHGAQLPLSMVHAGETVQVLKVRGTSEMRNHLAELGFVPGAEVHVDSASSGDVIVIVKGARVALNKQVSSHIVTV